MITRPGLVLLACSFTGGIACSGKYATGTTTPAARPGPPRGGIAAAALPYQVLDRNGRQLDKPAFWERVARARAVCIGEEHPNPHHHWVQLHVVEELGKRAAAQPKGTASRLGTKFALGLEMIQRPFQGVVDDYVAKRIDAGALRSRVAWEDRWGYDWGFYGPTIDAAIGFGGHVLALNASRELSKKISRQGLESLTPDEKALVPELKLDDAAHRGWFDGLMREMGGHGAHSQPVAPAPDDKPDATSPPEPAKPSPHSGGAPTMPSPERIYTVQVLWDETMADLSAKWLAANPTGQLVILAGNGHCHDSAIVGRLKRRGIADVISLRPVIDVDGNVAEILAKPMNDFVVVLQLPTPPAATTAETAKQ
ncbi:MAG: ChaN family lipoprotein [Deltaproteobacteria bacterium]|nr:ChaN family lipoprotein [Deltaproteobacteria bacterium]MDQ3301199.1 ChaN family lipoprotein [Myxococcota bacterium]